MIRRVTVQHTLDTRSIYTYLYHGPAFRSVTLLRDTLRAWPNAYLVSVEDTC